MMGILLREPIRSEVIWKRSGVKDEIAAYQMQPGWSQGSQTTGEPMHLLNGVRGIGNDHSEPVSSYGKCHTTHAFAQSVEAKQIIRFKKQFLFSFLFSF